MVPDNRLYWVRHLPYTDGHCLVEGRSGCVRAAKHLPDWSCWNCVLQKYALTKFDLQTCVIKFKTYQYCQNPMPLLIKIMFTLFGMCHTYL